MTDATTLILLTLSGVQRTWRNRLLAASRSRLTPLCHRRCNAARSAPGAEVETPVEIGKMNILDSADVLRVSES
jgi:hypothetical protein